MTHSVQEIEKIMTKFLWNELDQIRERLRMRSDVVKDLTQREEEIVTDRVETWMQNMIKQIKEHLCQH